MQQKMSMRDIAIEYLKKKLDEKIQQEQDETKHKKSKNAYNIEMEK